MATGIVSAAAAAEGLTVVGDVLGAVAGAVWVFVLAASATSPDDWTGGPGAGGLAFVAGTNVLAVRAGGRLGVALWCVAVVAWALVAATSALAVSRRGLGDGENGGWLLAAVATASLAVAVGEVRPLHDSPVLRGFGVAWWALAVALYVALLAVILARARRDLRAEDLNGEHWIAMGALAIATLAAAGLGTAGLRTPELVLWIAATAWIPVLVGVEVWRARRVPGPWRYHASRWATVFPLGMYANATHAVAVRHGLPALRPVAAVAFGVAAVAWTLAALGLARRVSAG